MAPKKESLSGQISGALNLLDKLASKFTDQFDPKVISKFYEEAEAGAVNVTKEFGQGRENMRAILATIGDATEGFARLGGSHADAAKMIQTIAESLGRNVIVSEDTAKKVYATYKASGIESTKLVTAFKDVGYSVDDIDRVMMRVLGTASSFGVNAQKVATEVTSNIKLLNQYNFQGGIEGLAKMASQAVSLRVSISDISGMMTKAFQPESAIEMAAALQRLGVAQTDLLDPLRLLDLSQNDPTELMNQVAEMSKQFVRLNEAGQFEILPGEKRRLMEIEQQMGLTTGALSRMALGSAELEDKMKRIKFSKDFVSDKDRELIAMISEKKGDDYVVKFKTEDDKVVTKKIDELNETEIKRLKEIQEKAKGPKTMEELAQEQLTTQEFMEAHLKAIAAVPAIVTGSKFAGDVTEVMRQMTKATSVGLRQIVTGDVSKSRIDFDNAVKDNINSITNLIKGEGSIKDVVEVMGNTIKNLTTTFDTNLKTAAQKAADELNKINGENQIGKIGSALLDLVEKKFGVKAETNQQNQQQGSQQQGSQQNSGASIIQPKVMVEPIEMKQPVLKIEEQPVYAQNRTEESKKIQVTLDINVKGDNIDTNQLLVALGHTDVKQSIIEKTYEGIMSEGRINGTNPINFNKSIVEKTRNV